MVKDAISESSFAKSKYSEVSQAEQTRIHNDKKKSVLVNAKLKKKRNAKPSN